jgi:starch-binding outer membrane protein SusE/F
MKKLISLIFAASLLIAFGCADDVPNPGFPDVGSIPTEPISSFEVVSPTRNTALQVKENLDTVVIEWERATGAATYEWIADEEDGDFSTPLLVIPSDNGGSSNKLTLTNEAIFIALGTLGVEKGESVTLKWTVKAISNNVSKYAATPRIISFTRGSALLATMFLVGNATPAGWDNATKIAMFRQSDANIFTYTGKFNVGEFKLLERSGSWQPQWGRGSEDGTLGVNPGGGNDPGSIAISSEGYYTVTINLEERIYSVVPYDIAGKPTYASIAIIGAATPNGWDGPDTDMTTFNIDPHNWIIEAQILSIGEMKFRANNAWDAGWGNTPFPYGIGNLNTFDNISVPESGNYLIRFCDLTSQYALIKL